MRQVAHYHVCLSAHHDQAQAKDNTHERLYRHGRHHEHWRRNVEQSRHIAIFDTKLSPQLPDVAARLTDGGFMNPRDAVGFKARLDADFERWLPWLKEANIRSE